MTTGVLTCRICSTSDLHQTHIGREMMFGSREAFAYFACSKCGCLQIKNIPSDLSRFYPPEYNAHNVRPGRHISPFRVFFRKQRFRNALFNRGYKLNKLLSQHLPILEPKIEGVLSITKTLKTAGVIDFSTRFLDVGCGSWSKWLENLRSMGFPNLYGIDPFIPSGTDLGGIKIDKRSIFETQGSFQFISFHHSLEHIPDQQSTLRRAHELLARNGTILVRIPTVSSRVWERYGVNWIEMDPPRHLYLHSRESIRKLGEQVGLTLYEVLDDSSEFEFYGSEQYRRDIPLNADNSYWRNENASVFSKEEIEAFRIEAREVNRLGVGGRAAFLFRSA